MHYTFLRIISVFVLLTFLPFSAYGLETNYVEQITDLQHAGDTDLAVELAKKYQKEATEQHGADHRGTIDASYTLGMALFMDGQYDQAIGVLSAALDALEKQVGESHPDLEPYFISLSSLYYTVSRFEDGDRVAARAGKLKN